MTQTWTHERIQLLKELYPAEGPTPLAKRWAMTPGAVRNKASRLQIKWAARADWTADEDAVLREWYARPIHPKGFLVALTAELGRTRASVALRASHLGITDWYARKVAVYADRKAQQRRVYVSTARFTRAERSAFQSAAVRQWIATHGHPRGALGMKHSKQTLALLAAASRRSWANPDSGLNSAANRQRMSDEMIRRRLAGLLTVENAYSRTVSGKRVDLDNRFFRSSWEANYARFLNFQLARGAIVSWDYECQVFVFETIKRGTRSYTPDFKVVYPDGHHEWHEVKGWMDPKSITRIARMRRYYPLEPLRIIDEEWFKDARRKGLPALLPYWETRKQ